MANRNWASGGKIYAMHVKPVLIEASFLVDDTQVNGISSLKGPCISAIYMNSAAATPSSPNPVAGTIVVRLQDNYNQLLAAPKCTIVSPSSGSDVKIDNSAMTAGVAYTITTLGDATAAKWHTIGVPAGVTPAVGVSFVALSNGGAGNTLTSRVQASATNGSGIASIEMVRLANGDISPLPSANQGYGAQFILQCYDYAGAKAAPAAGSQLQLMLYLSDSSVVTNGVQSAE